jgi:hypothetical protein
MMVACDIVVGGGVRRDDERLRARSWWACFEWETARWGREGVSLEAVPADERLPDAVFDLFGDVAVSKNPLRWTGSGEIGDDSIEEVSGEVAGVLRKLLEVEEKSEPSAERRETLDEPLETDLMSGAFKAWTLVVERSSVGNEILERSMVPAAYLKWVSEGPVEASCWRFARLVKALASAMVEVAILVHSA